MAGLCSELEGIFAAGIKVTQSLAEFYTAPHTHQDVKIAPLSDDLIDLLRTFVRMHGAARNRGSRQNEDGVDSAVRSGIVRCRRVIYELYDEKGKFTISTSTGKRRGCHVLIDGVVTAYPFRPSTLQKLDEDIKDVRDVLARLMGLLQMTDVIDTQDIQGVDEIKALADSVQRPKIAMSLQLWLSAPHQTVPNHRTACAKRHPGTGLWFLKGPNFSTWLKGNDSFLWLNGISGCGKTVLCSSAILHTFWHKRSDPSNAVAYFYFNSTNSGTESNHDDADMLRGLILQLANQLEVEDEGLAYLCNRGGAASTSALLKQLRGQLLRFSQTWILLDGLDECYGDEPRARVLAAIETIRNWAMPGLHVLVTSRDQPDIRGSLKASADEQVSMSGPVIDLDIACFIAGKLEADPKLRKWLRHRDQIQNVLVERAKGVFRWVECQLESLQQCRGSKDDLERWLEKLPHSLHETYSANLLRSINAGTTAQEASRLLNILTYAPCRPLALGQAIDALAVDLTTTPGHLDRSRRLHSFDEIRNLCPGMVDFFVQESIHHDPILGVLIPHHSVQEYLESKSSVLGASDEILAKTEMLHVFLAYLTDPSYTQACVTFSTGDWDKDYLVRLNCPLAYYAAENWLECYQPIRGKETSESRMLVLSLFKNPTAFQEWLRIYNPDAIPNRFLDSSRDYSDGLPSPVYYASLLGLDEIVIELLHSDTGGASSGTDIHKNLLDQDLRGHYGGPLHAAAAQGHLSTVKILLEAGASIDLDSFNYGTPLSAASLFRHGEVVKYLLGAGAKVNDSVGDYYGPALTSAAHGGDEKIVKMLLDSGADVHGSGGTASSALEAAASAYATESRTKIVQLLLDAGAKVNAAAGDSGSALRAAAFGIGDDEAVKLLLDAGANVNSAGGRLGSALQAAAAHGGAEKTKVSMLLEAGADPNVQSDGAFVSALTSAAYHKRGHEILPMLLAAGADVNATGGRHGSALWAASKNGSEEAVQTPLDAGADVNSSNGARGTALKVAIQRGHTKVVEILKARGARED